MQTFEEWRAQIDPGQQQDRARLEEIWLKQQAGQQSLVSQPPPQANQQSLLDPVGGQSLVEDYQAPAYEKLEVKPQPRQDLFSKEANPNPSQEEMAGMDPLDKIMQNGSVGQLGTGLLSKSLTGDPFAPEENEASGIIGGAMQGAQMGSAAGTWGTLIGGVVGGVGGKYLSGMNEPTERETAEEEAAIARAKKVKDAYYDDQAEQGGRSAASTIMSALGL